MKLYNKKKKTEQYLPQFKVTSGKVAKKKKK